MKLEVRVNSNDATRQKTKVLPMGSHTHTLRQAVHPHGRFPTIPRVVWITTQMSASVTREKGESKHVINQYLLETSGPLILIHTDTAAKADQ